MATKTDDTLTEVERAESDIANKARGQLQAVADKLTRVRDEALEALDEWDARLENFDGRIRNDLRSKRGPRDTEPARG